MEGDEMKNLGAMDHQELVELHDLTRKALNMRALVEALELVHRDYPDVTSIVLEASDQGLDCGYVLSGFVATDDEPDWEDELRDALSGILIDVEQNYLLAEDEYGCVAVEVEPTLTLMRERLANLPAVQIKTVSSELEEITRELEEIRTRLHRHTADYEDFRRLEELVDHIDDDADDLLEVAGVPAHHWDESDYEEDDLKTPCGKPVKCIECRRGYGFKPNPEDEDALAYWYVKRDRALGLAPATDNRTHQIHPPVGEESERRIHGPRDIYDMLILAVTNHDDDSWTVTTVTDATTRPMVLSVVRYDTLHALMTAVSAAVWAEGALTKWATDETESLMDINQFLKDLTSRGDATLLISRGAVRW